MMNVIPRTLLDKEVAAMIRRYKISRAEAEEALRAAFMEKPALSQKIQARFEVEDVTRWRAYRDVIKEVKKEIYYSLRKYRGDPVEEKALAEALGAAIEAGKSEAEIAPIIAGLLRSHISTKERYPHYPAFYDTLFSRIDPPSSVLDLGCGLHPLSFPFGGQAGGGTYVAVDRQKDVTAILRRYAVLAGSWTLRPVESDLAEFRPGRYLPGESSRFDIIFMLKLIPVLERQTPSLLTPLAALPGGTILVTASTEALSRREDISAREDRSLRRFIGMTGRKIAGDFVLPNEFGYFIV
jgi:16S rRNA (guanine(1405)-N(7))-methyltransferase